jgi:Icc-related predicted phosphoesterase
MKIAVASDLHLEFNGITFYNIEGADVLVLAGDICVAHHFVDGKPTYRQLYSKEYREFFDHVCKEFPHVIYIMGNHEHYSGDFAKTHNILREHLDYSNLHILNKQIFELEDVTFICSTLWTDMNNEDPLTLLHTQGAMNDFREVMNSNRMVTRKVPLYQENPLWTHDGKNGGFYSKDEKGANILIGYKDKEEPARFTPEDSVMEHKKAKSFIDIVARDKNKVVVVSHHAPSSQSIAYYYSHDRLMNGAFRSELDEFIEQRPQIKLWIHGHTHTNFDYMIGETRVVCNPRGYDGYEAIADQFKLQYVEV